MREDHHALGEATACWSQLARDVGQDVTCTCGRVRGTHRVPGQPFVVESLVLGEQRVQGWCEV